MTRCAGILLLAVLPGFAQDGNATLQRALGNVHRRHAERLLDVAQAAGRSGQLETARALRIRVLELDPDHLRARLELGYRKGRDGWERSPEREAEILEGTDADPMVAAGFAQQALDLERGWVREQVRVCNKYASETERMAVLAVLLERFPDDEDLRVALGHRKIHGSWVRPELFGLVERMPEQLGFWRSFATMDVELVPLAPDAPPPGLTILPTAFRAGTRVVASTLPPDVAEALARDVVRTQLMVRALLGEGDGWDPAQVLFLMPQHYDELIRAQHADDETFALYKRYDNYEHADFYAIRSWNRLSAAERYAHGAGHLTMWERAAPPAPSGREGRDADEWPWLREGFGYLVAFEMLDRGYLDFVSLAESSAKRTYTRDVPAQKTLAECRDWVREQIAAGYAYPLREVVGMRLNALDFCASMQAWSFVRFLLLYDAEAFRRLPAILRSREPGSELQRTDRALKACFGKTIDELAPLWRAFAIEVDL